MHLIGVDAEAVAQKLLVDGLVALALGDRARHQSYRAAAVEADLSRLKAARRGALDRVGEAEAAQFAVAARFGAPACEASGVGEFECHIEGLFELAAIVSKSQARFERHSLGWDRITSAQFNAVDAELVGGLVDHPLDDITRFG